MSDAEVSDDAPQWRWADANGAQQVVDEWDLVASLSSGQLPPCALVWRTGWTEWLPASRVAELAAALPAGKAEPPVTPTLDVRMTEPPPPPLEHYESEATRQAAAKIVGGSTAPGLGGKPPRVTTPPLPPGTETAGAGRAGRAGIFVTPPPPPPPAPQRPPMPTLVDMPRQGATVTLRPPGAIPPPPRMMPGTPHPVLIDDAFEDRGRAPIATPIPDPIENREASRHPPIVGGASPAGTAPDAPPGGPPEPRRIEPGVLAAAARFPLALLVLGGLAAVLLVTVVVLIVTRSGEPSSETVGIADTEQGAGAQTPAAAGPCKLVRPARRLSSAIFLGVPPSIAPMPGGSTRVAVGMAASRTLALGITLDASSLDAATVFRQPGTTPLIGVVPLTAEGSLRFAADREGGALASARTIDARPPFVVGVTDEGIAVSAGQGEPRIVWPSQDPEGITEIRVASVEAGHALTFRRGGQSGRVLAGWLAADGTKKSGLEAVQAPARFVGTPVVASNDREVLVAFANRGSADEYWALALATAPHGKVPERARRYATPAGGHGAGSISPAVGGVRGGRWLLQWTEGGSGQHQVRMQTLDADLVAVGDPIDVSPNQANAGQGVVWVQGQTALSLFVVTKGTNNELWGAALQCP